MYSVVLDFFQFFGAGGTNKYPLKYILQLQKRSRSQFTLSSVFPNCLFLFEGRSPGQGGSLAGKMRKDLEHLKFIQFKRSVILDRNIRVIQNYGGVSLSVHHDEELATLCVKGEEDKNKNAAKLQLELLRHQEVVVRSQVDKALLSHVKRHLLC